MASVLEHLLQARTQREISLDWTYPIPNKDAVDYAFRSSQNYLQAYLHEIRPDLQELHSPWEIVLELRAECSQRHGLEAVLVAYFDIETLDTFKVSVRDV